MSGWKLDLAEIDGWLTEALPEPHSGDYMQALVYVNALRAEVDRLSRDAAPVPAEPEWQYGVEHHRTCSFGGRTPYETMKGARAAADGTPCKVVRRPVLLPWVDVPEEEASPISNLLNAVGVENSGVTIKDTRP